MCTTSFTRVIKDEKMFLTVQASERLFFFFAGPVASRSSSRSRLHVLENGRESEIRQPLPVGLCAAVGVSAKVKFASPSASPRKWCSPYVGDRCPAV